jgi:hypothetical protein
VRAVSTQMTEYFKKGIHSALQDIFKKCDSNPFWVIFFAQIPSDKIPLMSHARHMYDV